MHDYDLLFEISQTTTRACDNLVLALLQRLKKPTEATTYYTAEGVLQEPWDKTAKVKALRPKNKDEPKKEPEAKSEAKAEPETKVDAMEEDQTESEKKD